jgi:hypothetical protein
MYFVLTGYVYLSCPNEQITFEIYQNTQLKK